MAKGKKLLAADPHALIEAAKAGDVTQVCVREFLAVIQVYLVLSLWVWVLGFRVKLIRVGSDTGLYLLTRTREREFFIDNLLV